MDKFPQRGDFLLWDEEGHEPLLGMVTKVTTLKRGTRFTFLSPGDGFTAENETKVFPDPQSMPEALTLVDREALLDYAVARKDGGE